MRPPTDDPTDDLAANLAAYRAARPEAATPPEAADRRISDYDARLREALEANQRQLLSGLDARGASLKGLVELSMRYHLAHVSRFFLRFFRLPQRFRSVEFDPPVFFCETLDEFIAARLERYHLAPALKAAELARLKAEGEAAARDPGRGVLGVYLSGQGCYLNGWLFNYGRPGQPRDLLRATSPDMPRVLSTAVHELLGHGFLAEFSALGAEKKAVGLQDWEYAQRFQFRAVDTSAQTLLVRKLDLAQRGSRLLEEGWSTWIASLFTQALLGQPRQRRYTLTQTWAAVDQFPVSASDKAIFRDLLSTLFLEPPGDPEALLPAVRLLQSVALDWDFAAGLDQPPAYVVGSLLLDQLEARLGLLNVPYALLIAANVTYDLLSVGWNDMLSLLWRHPRFNPDWRLAALGTLAFSEPPTLTALTEAAHNQLNLAVPAALNHE